MPTVVEHSSGPRNRWLLPAVLTAIIAAVVIGAIFIPKLTKSSSSPTTTPNKAAVGNPTNVVVTAVVTATNTGAGTGSTPLPGASPVPTHVGLTLGMITHPQRDVAQSQAGADRGDAAYSYRLDPTQVVQRDLSGYGFHGFQIVSPGPSPSPTTYTGDLNRQIVKYIISFQNQEFTVALAQPGKQGVHGVWFIVTILKGRHLP